MGKGKQAIFYFDVIKYIYMFYLVSQSGSFLDTLLAEVIKLNTPLQVGYNPKDFM